MIVLGQLALTLALVFCLASVVFLALGVRWDRKDLIRNGYYAVYGFFLTSVIASAVLLQAFLKKDFGFAYVAGHANEHLATFYRIAGFWAGQEGSFLFWTFLIATVAVIIALLDVNRAERLTGGAVMVLAVIGVVFAALMVLDSGSNPFVAATPGTHPAGLNPLLLHPAMVFHPPALFIGYVGLAVPFAFAISTLLLGRGDKLWVRRSQKWTVFGWLFLSLGIGLGAWWAYMELSFGGYWAWDPVENTSLVPWLTATALLHSFTLYKSRGIFKHWALALAVLSFWFTILATWTTRTGLIQSVHAFGQREMLVWILTGFLLGVAAVSIGLIAWRWQRFRGREEEIESLVSREFMYHVTNLLLTLFAVAVAFTTVAVPLLFDRSVGQETYNAIARPLGVVTVLLVSICPLLAWRRTEGAQLRRSLVLPAATAVLSAPLWLYLGLGANVWGFVGLVACGFAFGGVLNYMVHSARRAAGPGRSLWSGMGRAFGGSRSRTAAYLVHIGMVVIVAGLLGSSVYKAETVSVINAKAGETVKLGRYTLTFRGVKDGPGPQGAARSTATFDVKADGAAIGTVTPMTDVDPMMGAAVRSSILGRTFEDVFVVTDEPFDSAGEQLRVRVMVFPLMRWVWIGSILLVVGAAVSLWPKGRTQEQEARATGYDEAQGGADHAVA